MDCKDFREALDLYVDGELAAEANSAAQLHEQECASCRKTAVALLRLRRQMKSVVAQHQPPPELLNAVRRISQPRWKLFFGTSAVQSPPATGPQKSFSVWRKSVPVPLPAFALLLIAVVLGAWSVTRRITMAPPSAPKSQVVRSTQVAGEPAKEETMNFSRFDRGQRLSIYKTRR
jgi:anti-sigma factor RsiW